jgi:hypothetical protein
LSYRKVKERDYAEIQLKSGGPYQALLKVADVPPTVCTDRRPKTVCSPEGFGQVLGRIPPKPLPDGYKPHWCAVTDCRMSADDFNVHPDDFPDLSVWDGWFVHEAGWVCCFFSCRDERAYS